MSAEELAQSGRPYTAARRFLLRGLTVIIAVLFALGVAEALARYFYVSPWYDSLIGDTAINSRQDRRPIRIKQFPFYNLRDESIDWSSVKSPDERRIIVLGDSFTYGVGVADHAAVFPSLLEERLNQDLRLPEVKHVDVLNGGVPASLTGHWIELWNSVSSQYQPDVLLIVFFLRDGTLTGSGGAFFGRIRDEIVTKNRESFLYRHFYLFRTIRDGFDRKSVGEKYTQVFMQSYFGNENQTGEWRRAQANLLKLQALAREQSIPVGFVIFPILFELNDAYPFRRICDRLEEFAIEHGLPVHNLLPAFMGEDGPSLWNSAFDQHPNARGHRIAADSMLPFVKGLVESQEAGRK